MVSEPVWDDERADELVGKTVIVGLTHLEVAGDRVEQFYGEIISVDSRRGIELRLAGQRAGESFALPPDLRGILPARPGEYRLRTTGEIVENPDFTATLKVYPRGSGTA